MDKYNIIEELVISEFVMLSYINVRQEKKNCGY